MKRLFTKNLWNAAKGRFEKGLLEIEGERIAAVTFGEPQGSRARVKIIDLDQFYIGPSAIDLHIHSRDFEESYKETFETLEAGALAGGVSALVCMANTRPRLDTVSRVKEFLKRVSRLRVNCIPFAAVTENLEGKCPTDWNALLKMPVAGLSDDGRPIANAEIMKSALLATKKSKKILSLHEEDHAYSKASLVDFSPASMKCGLEGSPDISEFSMVERDLKLAELTEAPIHFGHISSRNSVDRIRKAKRRGLNISCELTPHHALLTADDILKVPMTERGLYKVCPVIRSQEDRESLLRGAEDGTLDCFASDHAPHADLEKFVPYDQAAHGIISLENHFSLYNQVRIRSKMSWTRYFNATTMRPAALLNLKGPVGISKGALANLLIFDPDTKVDLQWRRSKSNNTPFKKQSLKGRVVEHWIKGVKVYGD